MKKILGLATLMFSFASHAAFVHPLDFDGSEAQKAEVIDYIKNRVHQDYCDSALDMCQPTTLRMMEKQNLAAFKSLTSAKNRAVLDNVIDTYCDSSLDMCTYANLDMMYKQNLKASNESLSW
ncbi:hypothetical protein [Mixta intestinalis]|jgi:hypothetical protein|uniref:Uncharacterized protein n=1 Tax=Mixta intestinalis TaxID=1615494 RepID=A0A6P1Q3R7_9GAMM|nr:hypothetical protein [Mixta intestinalis]QHM72495.1 hypothetical protein C7M51_02808 [Mixta intestinalis]